MDFPLRYVFEIEIVIITQGFDVTKFRGKILEEIHYESERQGMSNIRNERGKTVNVKPYLQHLLVLRLFL